MDGILPAVVLTGVMVGAVVAGLCKGKAPGLDGLAYEHVYHAGPQLWDVLAALFLKYLFDLDWPGNNMSPAAWSRVLVLLLPKEKAARSLDRFRPISLTSCAQKVYLKLVTQLVDHSMGEPPSYVRGFVRGRQPADIIFTVNQAIQKSVEWGRPLYMCKIDVSAAFDSFHHEHLEQALRSLGVPSLFVFAWLRELFRAELFPSVAGHTSEECVVPGKGGRQGGVETPLMWRAVTQWLMDPLLASWRQRGIGWAFAGWHAPCFLFVDDFVLLANSLEELQ